MYVNETCKTEVILPECLLFIAFKLISRSIFVGLCLLVSSIQTYISSWLLSCGYWFFLYPWMYLFSFCVDMLYCTSKTYCGKRYIV